MKLSPRWARTTEWVLGQLTRPPAQTRARSVALVGGLVFAIGLVNYVSGIQISLVVLYLVPIGFAVAWLGWRGGLLTAVCSVAVRETGDLLQMHGHPPPLWAVWNVSAAAVMYGVAIWMLHSLLTVHRRLEDLVEERTRALKVEGEAREQLVHELAEIGIREQNSIGRELHDDLCQHLVGTALAAQVLARRLREAGSDAAKDAGEIVAWLEAGIAKTRKLARGLLLTSIEPKQLGRELAELALAGSADGIRCEFHHEGNAAVADDVVSAQIFRIAQEAVRNALYHAGASRIDVTLAGDANAVCLTVADNGRGMPPQAWRGSGMGLHIMEHRATLVGGTFSLVTPPSGGTRVVCHFPRYKTRSSRPP